MFKALFYRKLLLLFILFNILFINNLYENSIYVDNNSELEHSYTCNYKNNTNINNSIYIYSINIVVNRIIFMGAQNPFINYNLSCYLVYKSYSSPCRLSVRKLYNINKRIKMTLSILSIAYSIENGVPNSVKINNNIIPVLIIKKNTKYNLILAVVSFFNIHNYKQVIDVIELSKMYGVEHIIIYATSSTLLIKSILFHYMKTKFVEIVPFCLNEEIRRVHHFGQIIKINDVLYRFMNRSKFIIFSDIDEIIIPVKHRNYLSLLKSIDNRSSDFYIFKSKLFSYNSLRYTSIVEYRNSCIVKRGYQKYIVGNLHKFSVLSVHTYINITSSIKLKYINEKDGYVRHTRFNTSICKANEVDNSLDYINFYLSKIYKKFESIYYNNINYLYYYGK